MKKKKLYQKPFMEKSSFLNTAILVESDNVGLITDEGGNAAKYDSTNLWDDDSEE